MKQHTDRAGHGKWHILALFLFVLTGVHLVVGAQEGRASIDELYTQAWSAYHEDYDPDRALTLAQNLINREDLIPDERIRALLLDAICHVALDRDQEAKSTIERILSIDPDYRLDVSRVPPTLWRIYYNHLNDQGRFRFSDGVKTLAILDLTNNSITEHEAMEGLSQGIADRLINDLVGATRMRLVERERIDFICQENEQQQGEEFDSEYAVRVGHLLGAQYVIVGGFMRYGNRIGISVRVVSVETSEIMDGRSGDGKMDKLFEILRKLSKGLCDDLDTGYADPADSRDTNLGAFLEYSQGLALLRQDRTSEALSYFQRAVDLDEEYPEARARVQQLAPLVAGSHQGD